MKLFLVYFSYYGEILGEIGNATSIEGIFKTREEAERLRENLIKEDIENGWIIDKEVANDYLSKDIVIMFWAEQENWNNYYEICIKEMEVK